MSEFHELIKDFERIRDYMRQFYVYGFKVRQDYDEKSARTYDNERRRIESFLSGYVRSGYTKKGKQISIVVDSKTIPQNPLYAVWKAKSFTDNELMLHFFFLDLLGDGKGMSVGELCDEIPEKYGIVFDSQVIRMKLKYYEEIEMMESKREGKVIRYYLIEPLPVERADKVWEHLIEALKFFQEAAPFGFIGSTILDREEKENNHFRFKNHFLVHTLEDEVLADILNAMRKQQSIFFFNVSHRSNTLNTMLGTPLKIFSSTQTGRRYLCMYSVKEHRIVNVRLDCISDVQKLMDYEEYKEIQKSLKKNLPKCWGVSFGQSKSHSEKICVKLFLDEEKEPHLIERLYQESRSGEVQRIRENEYLFSGTFFDTNEILPWIKSFTGHIMDIQGTNKEVILKVITDWEKMYQMYVTEQREG